MTTLREAAQDALNWLYENDIVHPSKVSQDLRAALEQPEQEPVAWMVKLGDVTCFQHHADSKYESVPLYTSPPQQQAEPVAWMCCVPGQDAILLFDEPSDERYPPKYKDPLYTTPPQRKPLTTDERGSIVNEALRGHASTRDAIDWAIRHVERHHGIGEKP